MRNTIVDYKPLNTGFHDSIIDEREHYMLGDGWLSPMTLMKKGQSWEQYLPDDEFQNRNNVETMNCTNYGTLHALATLGNRLFNTDQNGVMFAKNARPFQANLSERYTGIISGTTQYGNDPHHVVEVIRTISGCIPEVYLPFDSTITTFQKYYSPRPISFSLFKTGYSWMKKYEVGHDWVFSLPDTPTERKEKMMIALKYSPLGAAGFAWSLHGDGKYYSDGPANHWFTVYGYVENDCWLVFDSYDNTHKKLDWNYNFSQAKRYSIRRRVGSANESEPRFLETLTAYLSYLFKSYTSV